MSEETKQTPPASTPASGFDWKTLGIVLLAALIGAAWAYYNFTSTGGERGEPQLRPLVWTIFATPLALFLGWVLARRSETWLAAFTCFCLYFFSPFIAARIESLVYTTEQAAATNHALYFQAVIVVNLVGAVACAIWRAMRPAHPPAIAQPEQQAQLAD